MTSWGETKFPIQRDNPLVYEKALTQILSHVQLFPTPWTVAHQDPMFMGFSRQEYWNGVPFPPPGDLPNPEIKHMSLSAGGF